MFNRARGDLSNLIEKFERRKIFPNNPLSLPENGVAQERPTVHFDFYGTDQLADWYEAYISLQFQCQKKGNGNKSTLGDHVTPIEGGFSFVERLKVMCDEVELVNSNEINKLQWIKKVLSTNKTYSETLGGNEWWFPLPDKEETQLFSNFRKRIAKLLVADGNWWELKIPLKEWGFFASLRNHLLPPKKISIKIDFRADEGLLYSGKVVTTAARVVLRDLSLIVPTLFPKNEEGRKKIIAESMADKKIPFFKESVFSFQQNRKTLVNQKLSDASSNINHVFFLLQLDSNARKAENKNPYFFDTFLVRRERAVQGQPNLPNAGVLTNIKLKCGDDEYFPDKDGYEGRRSQNEIFQDACNFARRESNQNFGGIAISKEDWAKHHSFVHFDLSSRKNQNFGVEQEISFSLDADPQENYTMIVGTLTKKNIHVKDGKVFVDN